MHPSLAPHLHSECREAIDMLNSCHTEHPYGKFFGKCNDAKLKMIKCIEEEDLRKRRLNRVAAKESAEKSRRYKQSMKDM